MTDARKTILARRARFIAAAIASAGVAGCGGDAASSACLSTYVPQDGGSDVGADARPCNAPDVSHEAQMCLQPQPPDAADADAGPQVCLSQPPPDAADEDTGPQVCLKIAPDASDDADAGPQMCLQPPPADAAND
jgi:hypothetical protein